MKKKYLKTVEDVLALKDTDTKIYISDSGIYHQFVNGVLCKFINGYWVIGSCVYLGDNPYTLEEEPMQEATEEDVGKLCWFWDGEQQTFETVAVLSDINNGRFETSGAIGIAYNHCRPLTKEEIKEFMEKAK